MQKSSDKKSEEKTDGYEVGYRKPPKHSQFKPGQSGNPNGRPRGASLATQVRNLLSMSNKKR